MRIHGKSADIRTRLSTSRSKPTCIARSSTGWISKSWAAPTGDTAREEVLLLIRNTVNSEAVPLSFAERERLAREILDEIFGLGPLEPLLKDPTISDILVNRFDRVYVERAGKLEPTGLSVSKTTRT